MLFCAKVDTCSVTYIMSIMAEYPNADTSWVQNLIQLTPSNFTKLASSRVSCTHSISTAADKSPMSR